MSRLRRALGCLLLVAGLGAALAVDAQEVDVQTAKPTSAGSPSPVALAEPSLPNAYRIHAKVISGGQPEGDSGFRTLRKLGVRTIISVDGAKPDVETARKYGLRYLHLPHGYDGIPKRRVAELAKAISDLPAPLYIHCHHGKHRSPAAAAAGCIGAGYISRQAGRELLRVAGTSKDYEGLHEVVNRTTPVPGLDLLQVKFRETVEVPALAAAMVQIEHRLDHLKQIEAAGWQSPESHPDLSPKHEALLLREHYTELFRQDDVKAKPAGFSRSLESSRARAEQLERQLRATPQVPSNADKRRLSTLLEAVQRDCKACHQAFRDRPPAARD